MKKLFIVVLAVIATLMLLSSCAEATNPEAGSGATGESTVVAEKISIPVYLTDKRILDVNKLLVDITGVKYKWVYPDTDEGSMMSVVADLRNVDLLSLAGSEMEWFDMDIPEGAELQSVEFKVSSATAVIDGEEEAVQVPSDKIKVLVNGMAFSTGEGLLIDFDVSQSLVKAGKKYILKPVVKAFKKYKKKGGKEETYTVSGTVTESGSPVSGAIIALLDEEESTVVRSTLSMKNGMFKLRGVEEGDYKLNVYMIGTLSEGSDLTDYEASYSTNLHVDEDIDLGVVDIGTPSEGASPTENASVSILFSDDPTLGIDHVYVYVGYVDYTYEFGGEKSSGSVSLNENVDLLSLAGEELKMTELPIPSGAILKSVGVEIKSVEVIAGGETYPVDLKNSYASVNLNLKVSGDLGVVLDFDMMQSLFKSTTGYSFDPFIKGMVEDPSNPQYKITGKVLISIGGITTQPAAGFIVALFSGSEVFRVTLTKSNGTFRVFNIPNGDYTLKVYQPQILQPGQKITDLPLLYSGDVTVSSSDLDIGDIIVSISL